LTDERFNPESEMPQKWRRKILESILPNNRKLLRILEANRRHLLQEEIHILSRFRQHVDDFEAKHLGDSSSSGIQFPAELDLILTDP